MESQTKDILLVLCYIVPIVVAIMIQVYRKGFARGMKEAKRDTYCHISRVNLDAMLSEYDGSDEGNGEITRISHGEMVQLETEAKSRIQQSDKQVK